MQRAKKFRWNTRTAPLLGGAPLEGRRYIWWNLVSSSRERIEQAKSDWLQQRFAKVPGETEFIPLPSTETHPPPL